EGDNYTFNVLGIDRIYSTPLNVHVTNVDSRIETYSHTVAYTFKDFCLSYFQSYSFEYSYTCEQGMISSKYHPILNKAQNMINTTKQTAIISTVWWGLYSIQLPPAYLL
ncbi:unnamed protein product, partial [Rotaria sp. Silwood1]